MQEAETSLPDHYVYNLAILPGYVLWGENYAMKWFWNTGKAPKVATNGHAPGKCQGFPFPIQAPVFSSAVWICVKQNEPHGVVAICQR